MLSGNKGEQKPKLNTTKTKLTQPVQVDTDFDGDLGLLSGGLLPYIVLIYMGNMHIYNAA